MLNEPELKINYVSPYKKLQEKKKIKEKYMSEQIEMTPYEYWKSFIGDEETTEEVVDENLEIQEEVTFDVDNMTSYEKWKLLLKVK